MFLWWGALTGVRPPASPAFTRTAAGPGPGSAGGAALVCPPESVLGLGLMWTRLEYRRGDPFPVMISHGVAQDLVDALGGFMRHNSGGMRHVPNYNKSVNPGSGKAEMSAAKRVAAGAVDTGSGGNPHASAPLMTSKTSTTKRGALDS